MNKNTLCINSYLNINTEKKIVSKKFYFKKKK